MEKEFIPYELALKLKEFGFDEICFGYWSYEYERLNLLIELTTSSDANDEMDFPNFKCLAPLWQQAFDWFRTKYNLEGTISTDVWSSKKSTWRICGGIVGIVNAGHDSLYDWDSEDYDTYEEARFNCLQKLIELIK